MSGATDAAATGAAYAAMSRATLLSYECADVGYGDGPDWAKSKAYFEKAWPAVMASLEKKYAAR